MKDPIDRSGLRDLYWERVPLKNMTKREWEALCDGCGKCCLNKLEDPDTQEIAFTRVACRLLDVERCRCTDYANRAKEISECLVLSADRPEAFKWLPASCAYRRLANGRDLPGWHPLVTGTPESVHEAGISIRDFAVSENETTEWSIVQDLGANEE